MVRPRSRRDSSSARAPGTRYFSGEQRSSRSSEMVSRIRSLSSARYWFLYSSGSRGVPPRFSIRDRKSTRLNSSHRTISYAVFCLKKKKKKKKKQHTKKIKKKIQKKNNITQIHNIKYINVYLYDN